jgi:hypothetical protein
MKASFDNNSKDKIFSQGDLIPKWDKIREEHGNHGKFDKL